jgi:hypothetical protein
LTLREILSVEPATQKPLRYSEVPISFSRDDQWTSFSEPEKFPLVLDPIMVGSQLTRVLIDGGSGLNLLFTSTLKNMGLDISKMLTPSRAPFYGIVPGNAATPLGLVILPVTFRTKENYRTKYIKFEVTDFESSYMPSSADRHWPSLRLVLYASLLKGPRSHDKAFTSLRLVLRVFDYFDYSSHLQIWSESTLTSRLHRQYNIQRHLGHCLGLGASHRLLGIYYATHLATRPGG